MLVGKRILLIISGGWRDAFASMRVILPRQDTLKVFHDDESLDAANPRSRHILAEMVGR